MSASGLSEARLARMRGVMAGHVERGTVAGIVTALYRHGEARVETFGSLAFGGPPMRRDGIFRIASMTKPVAAAAAMILVEEGRLRLDEPVDRWLPEMADRRVLRAIDRPLEDTVPADRPITLRDLLTLRLGLGMTMAPPGTYPIQRAIAEAGIAAGPTPPALPPDEMIAAYGRLPLMYRPGERWLYHHGYDILGVLIARAAGMPLADFLAERIFAPLGMRDTGFSLPVDRRDRLAGCYEADPDGDRLAPCDDGPTPVFPSGSAGLLSTADDFLAFGRMMLGLGRLGRERVMARPTIEAMTTDQLTPAQKAVSPFFPGFWESRGWGFGVAMVTHRDGPAAVPGAYGWTGGFGTTWFCDPREGMVGVLLAQRLYDETVTALHADFLTLAYQAIDD